MKTEIQGELLKFPPRTVITTGIYITQSPKKDRPAEAIAILAVLGVLTVWIYACIGFWAIHGEFLRGLWRAL